MENGTKSVKDKLEEDLKSQLKRLTELQKQKVLQEQILRSLMREMNGVEAVVAYIRGTLKNVGHEGQD